MEKALATALMGLESEGREDLGEGLLALWEAGRTLSKRALVMHVDGEAICRVAEEIAAELDEAFSDEYLAMEVKGWVLELAEAVADFPPTVRGLKASAEAKERLGAVLLRGGEPDDDVYAPLKERPALSLLISEALG